MNEYWLPVVGFEGWYEVSSLGRVRSLKRTMVVERWPGRFVPRTYQGKMLRPGLGGNGYLGVVLSAHGRKKSHAAVLVQYLVLEAFVGPRPPGAYCCHADGDRVNNHLSNLRWDTPAANSDDAKRHGTRIRGRRVAGALLDDGKVATIRALSAVFSRKTLADMYGVHVVTVADVIRGVTWKHVLD